jgi:Ser/Thr protein kinase RdoA (MazF antagonist)
MDTKSAWGDSETKFFFDLTPEKILDAVECSGLKTTGRCLPLNSMENRVYEIELDNDATNPRDRFVIAKFYRPGRWSKEQILEEHQFLLDLKEYEIPVIAPLNFESGSTLETIDQIKIHYALFPKCGGRNPDELDNEKLARLGRLMARLHNVGAIKKAEHRLCLTPETYGMQNLEYLLSIKALPVNIESAFIETVEDICEISAPHFENADYQRVHGECHLGNIIWGDEGPFLVDFDDMVSAPCVQDLWLMIQGRDDFSMRQMDTLLDAYEQMRSFPHETLKLIEPLRALRMIHFSAWIAKRWDDPAFKAVFLDFGTDRYWQEQLQTLVEQKDLITSIF